jgi:peptide deformylase
MVREIMLYGDPVLRTKCRRVEKATDEIRSLVGDMLETMRAANGIGLAAPQLGIPIQLAVIDVPHDETSASYLRIDGKDTAIADAMPLIFVNPELQLGRETEAMDEGCLSFPDLRGEVKRSIAVRARLGTIEGGVVEIEADGLLSRAIQHETDHLFGVLFIDRMSAAQKLGLKKKIREMREGRAP